MADNNQWYPFYPGDYARDTAHLSLLEHGAYRLLLDHYFSTGSPLPNDPAKLFRICRARTPSERQSVLSAVREFFVEDGTLLRSKRCDREIAKRLKLSESRSASAQQAHSKRTANAPAKGGANEGVTTATATTTEVSDDTSLACSKTREPTPFEVIYRAGCAAFPQLAAANPSPIQQWISNGCDPQLDVLPEIKRHSGKTITAWKYFTGGIIDAKATRESPLPKGTPHANTLASPQSRYERPSWTSAREQLAAKYRREAELEEQAALDGAAGSNLRLAEGVWEDAGGAGDAGGGVLVGSGWLSDE